MPVAAPPDNALLSVSWLNYYRHNRDSLLPIPWERGTELNAAERVAVAASIQEFQLGESSEGKQLVQRAEEFARTEGLSAYAEAVKLFVAEEHRHARDLGRVLDLAGVPRLHKAWADSVFRRLRHLANLEMSIRVLITAEIIAKVYYAALRDATGSTVLRTLCEQITRDEREHVRFQCDYPGDSATKTRECVAAGSRVGATVFVRGRLLGGLEEPPTGSPAGRDDSSPLPPPLPRRASRGAQTHSVRAPAAHHERLICIVGRMPFGSNFPAGLPAVLVLVFATVWAGPLPADPPNTPPNIVLFYIDDLGWSDLGCQGSTFYETPHIDRLAGEGMRFTNAYSPCPVCSPSRASLMTGKSTARVGFTGHITAIMRHRYPPYGRIIPPDDHMRLPLDEVSIARALKPAGYVSASIGKWHLGTEGYWPRDHGFNVNIAGHTHGSPASYFFPYLNVKSPWNPAIRNLEGGKFGEYLTERLTDEAIRFIEKNRKRPFFLYLTHYAVHTPIEAPPNLIDKYKTKLTTDDSQFDAGYAAMIETVDDSVGRVMATLSRLDLDENTVVIFTSDNGGESKVTRNRPLRAGKGYLYEGGIRVPLIVRRPGKVAADSVSETPTIGTDLYPTIAELGGEKARPGGPLDGRSLVSVFTGRGELAERDLFWYYPHYSPQAKRPGSAVRSGKYKLIENYDPPGVELYDLEADEGETVDLAEKMPERAANMRRKIHDWLRESGAKLHRENPAYRPSKGE